LCHPIPRDRRSGSGVLNFTEQVFLAWRCGGLSGLKYDEQHERCPAFSDESFFHTVGRVGRVGPVGRIATRARYAGSPVWFMTCLLVVGRAPERHRSLHAA